MLQSLLVFPIAAVISMPRHSYEMLERSDESSGPSVVDYSDRKPLPITIPDYQNVEQSGERFMVTFELIQNLS